MSALKFTLCLLILVTLTGCNYPDAMPAGPSPVASRLTLTTHPAVLLRSGSEATITARATDGNGTNVNGATVTFTTNAGSLSRASATTGEAGLVSVLVSGSNPARVVATLDGVSATVDLQAVAPFTVALEPISMIGLGGTDVVVSVAMNRDVPAPPKPSAVLIDCGVSAPPIDVTADLITRCVFPVAGDYTVRATARAANGWTVQDSVRVTARTAPVPAQPAAAITVSAQEISRGVGYAEWRVVVTATAPMATIVFDFDDGVTTTRTPDGTQRSVTEQHLYKTDGNMTIRVKGQPATRGPDVTASINAAVRFDP